jgi:hypothetical protein
MANVELTPEGFSVDDTHFWRLESAARLIGIHPQSLQRLYRNSGDTDVTRVGLKLGRGLFFTRDHLSKLGYTIEREVTIT